MCDISALKSRNKRSFIISNLTKERYLLKQCSKSQNQRCIEWACCERDRDRDRRERKVNHMQWILQNVENNNRWNQSIKRKYVSLLMLHSSTKCSFNFRYLRRWMQRLVKRPIFVGNCGLESGTSKIGLLSLHYWYFVYKYKIAQHRAHHQYLVHFLRPTARWY